MRYKPSEATNTKILRKNKTKKKDEDWPQPSTKNNSISERKCSLYFGGGEQVLEGGPQFVKLLG